jgi:hypothetical protein
MKSSLTVGMVILRIVILAIIGRFLVIVSSSHYYYKCSKGGSVGGHPTTIPPLTGGATSTVVRETPDQSMPITTSNNISLAATMTSIARTTDRAGEIMEGNQESKRRKMFLNRIAKVSSLLLRREQDAVLEDEQDELAMHDYPEWGMEVTPQSDLTRPGRHIHIVTTASLPWFTGTAVNPLLRAAYLHQRLKVINSQANMTTNNNNAKSSYVTLIIPWLELPEDQEKVYNGMIFKTPLEQEIYVRDWLRNQARMPDAANNLNLHFYNARYHAGLGSVFAMGDIIQQLPQDELDVCVLEEPEQ